MNTDQLPEPVAWRTFDGEGGYDYTTYDDDTADHADKWSARNPNHVGWVESLYTADQMRSYAAQAVAAERERCVKVCDGIAEAYLVAARRLKGLPASYIDGRSDGAHECATDIRKGAE